VLVKDGFLDKLEEQVFLITEVALAVTEHPKPETFASEPFFYEVLRFDTSLNIPFGKR
jgi:hypothetical protein